MAAIAAGNLHNLALVRTADVVPTITAHSTANNLTLLWPITAAAYRVESALSLSPPVIWSNVTGTIQTSGGSNSIVLPISGPQKFYRLVKP